MLPDLTISSSVIGERVVSSRKTRIIVGEIQKIDSIIVGKPLPGSSAPRLALVPVLRIGLDQLGFTKKGTWYKVHFYMSRPCCRPLMILSRLSALRLACEYSHRLIGIAFLGLAWLYCHTSIKWQVDNWDDSKDWTFGGITAGISGMIFLLHYGVRVIKKEREEETGLKRRMKWK
jgi:hypothetical protein